MVHNISKISYRRKTDTNKNIYRFTKIDTNTFFQLSFFQNTFFQTIAFITNIDQPFITMQ